MSPTRAVSFIVAMALHAGALWLLKPTKYEYASEAGEPDGPNVDVELVEETTAPEAPVEQPPEPPTPELPPEITPPEPAPPPEIVAESAPEKPEPPKPKPKPKPAPRPPTPNAKPGPPKVATAPSKGSRGSADAGNTKDTGAKRTRIVYPNYPARLKALGVQPRTEVLAVIGTDGRVISARVHVSSGYADFDQEAVRAARETPFEPATSLGVPVQDEKVLAFRGELRR